MELRRGQVRRREDELNHYSEVINDRRQACGDDC